MRRGALRLGHAPADAPAARAGVLVIAGAVWGVAQVQRDTADRAYREAAGGERMLDQETGLRGFALTRSEAFLKPFRNGVLAGAEAGSEVLTPSSPSRA
jgi:hypothetical protein